MCVFIASHHVCKCIHCSIVYIEIKKELAQCKDDLNIAIEAKEAAVTAAANNSSHQVAVASDYDQLKDKLEARNDALARSNETIASLKMDLMTTQHAMELANKEAESANLRIKSITGSLNELKDSSSRVKELEMALNDKDIAAAGLERDLRSTLQDLTNAQNKLMEAEKLKNSANHELDELNAVVKGMDKEISRLENDLKVAREKETGYEILHAELNHAKNALAEKDSSSDSLGNDLIEKDKELEQLRASIKELQKDVLVRETKQNDTSNSLQMLQNEMTRIQDDLNKATSHNSKLEADLSSLQGMYTSTNLTFIINEIATRT